MKLDQIKMDKVDIVDILTQNEKFIKLQKYLPSIHTVVGES